MDAQSNLILLSRSAGKPMYGLPLSENSRDYVLCCVLIFADFVFLVHCLCYQKGKLLKDY